MNPQNKHIFDDDHADDVNVLNYLLEHVSGISPSSLTPDPIYDEAFEIE